MQLCGVYSSYNQTPTIDWVESVGKSAANKIHHIALELSVEAIQHDWLQAHVTAAYVATYAIGLITAIEQNIFLDENKIPISLPIVREELVQVFQDLTKIIEVISTSLSLPNIEGNIQKELKEFPDIAETTIASIPLIREQLNIIVSVTEAIGSSSI